MEAAGRASSSESVSPDVWNDALARRSIEVDVPLVPLEAFGLNRLPEGMGLENEGRLQTMRFGAEAHPFYDREHGVVYKFFDLRKKGTLGTLGKRIVLERVSGEDSPGIPEVERYSLRTVDATLESTLEKLMFINDAGGHPTEIVGLTDGGHFLVAKQPVAVPISLKKKDFERIRLEAIDNMKGVVIRRVHLQGLVVALWVGGKMSLMADLHTGNIMRDLDGKPTVIDALLGSVPAESLSNLPHLGFAFEDAEALRKGDLPPARGELQDSPDDEL
ncbi:MAG: hypothetical protein AAGI48_16285 [Verrucomicrobiota bacterium]